MHLGATRQTESTCQCHRFRKNAWRHFGLCFRLQPSPNRGADCGPSCGDGPGARCGGQSDPTLSACSRPRRRSSKPSQTSSRRVAERTVDVPSPPALEEIAVAAQRADILDPHEDEIMEVLVPMEPPQHRALQTFGAPLPMLLPSFTSECGSAPWSSWRHPSSFCSRIRP